MTFDSSTPAPAKISKPRKIELPNENPDIENADKIFTPELSKPVGLPAGVANLWHQHKYHPTTFAMVIPTGDGTGDTCRLLVRVQVGGAGTAIAVDGAEMSTSLALKTLNDFYTQSRLTKQAF